MYIKTWLRDLFSIVCCNQRFIEYIQYSCISQVSKSSKAFYLLFQTGADAVAEVCREMGLENEDDVSEFGIFTYLEDRKFHVDHSFSSSH